MKTILLKLDDKLFFRLKADKIRVERQAQLRITWEDYFKLLFQYRRKYKK